MRLLVLSDLHLELGASFTPPQDLEDDYEVAVLAGDIHSPGHKAVHWAQRDSTFGGRPVILVPGNHEFYGRELTSERMAMRKAAADSNVHLLDRDSIVIDGVRFLGCMLWTDFQLPIRQPDGAMESDIGRALAGANQAMNDFRLIELQAPAKREHRGREVRRLLQAEDTLAMHWVDRDWLRRDLRKPFAGPTVVVTHHAPASGSVAAKYAGDALTPAFVSELPDEMFEVPALWVHGHSHTAADYRRGDCRVLSNPRGYRMRDGSFENGSFDQALVVKVALHQLSDPDFEPTGKQLQDLARRAWAGARADWADMVRIQFAAQLAGASCQQLERWAAQRRPRVIAFEDNDGALRFPKWQFEPLLWPVVPQLAAALDGDALAVLSWLESPNGAFAGRTPRMALEQGELAERVLAAAGAEGL
jgi:hypothetical protein